MCSIIKIIEIKNKQDLNYVCLTYQFGENHVKQL